MDNQQQSAWLDIQAKLRGFLGADDMALRALKEFIQLAEVWRAEHPTT